MKRTQNARKLVYEEYFIYIHTHTNNGNIILYEKNV